MFKTIILKSLKAFPKDLRDDIIRAMIVVKDDELDGLELSLAETPDEIETAARLVHDAYVARKVLVPRPSGLLLNFHMLLQNTFTLVARYKGKIVGTQSFILDSEFGVPLDKVYSEELGRLRAQKRCFMECGALAVAPGFRGKGVALLMNKMMFMCAERVVFIDDIVVSVSYYMEDFYRAMGWFRPFGPLRVYPGLNHNAMSIAMKVDVLNARKECFEKFAHKPRKSSNLYYTMLEQQHPQIQLPASLDPARRARWEAARRFMDADEELRAAWIGAGSPSPSFGSPVQVTETAPPFCVACCHI